MGTGPGSERPLAMVIAERAAEDGTELPLGVRLRILADLLASLGSTTPVSPRTPTSRLHLREVRVQPDGSSALAERGNDSGVAELCWEVLASRPRGAETRRVHDVVDEMHPDVDELVERALSGEVESVGDLLEALERDASGAIGTRQEVACALFGEPAPPHDPPAGPSPASAPAPPPEETRGVPLEATPAQPPDESPDAPPDETADDWPDEPPLDDELDEPPLDDELDAPPLDDGLDAPPLDDGADTSTLDDWPEEPSLDAPLEGPPPAPPRDEEPSEPPVAHEHLEPPAPAPPLSAAPHAPSVLLIGIEGEDREAISLLLRERGLRVHAASIEGWQRARRPKALGCIVTCYSTDFYELFLGLRTGPLRATPVVVLSSSADLPAASAVGADACVALPCPAGELLAAVERVLSLDPALLR